MSLTRAGTPRPGAKQAQAPTETKTPLPLQLQLQLPRHGAVRPAARLPACGRARRSLCSGLCRTTPRWQRSIGAAGRKQSTCTNRRVLRGCRCRIGSLAACCPCRRTAGRARPRRRPRRGRSVCSSSCVMTAARARRAPPLCMQAQVQRRACLWQRKTLLTCVSFMFAFKMGQVRTSLRLRLSSSQVCSLPAPHSWLTA